MTFPKTLPPPPGAAVPPPSSTNFGVAPRSAELERIDDGWDDEDADERGDDEVTPSERHMSAEERANARKEKARRRAERRKARAAAAAAKQKQKQKGKSRRASQTAERGEEPDVSEGALEPSSSVGEPASTRGWVTGFVVLAVFLGLALLVAVLVGRAR